MRIFEKLRLHGKLWSYLRDGRVARWRKWVGLASVAYVVWPLDLIPDAIPVLGWLDDLGVLSAAAWFVISDVRRHALADGKPAPPEATHAGDEP